MTTEQMTTEQMIKYLKDTDHLVVKWVNRLDAPSDKDTTMYHTGYGDRFELVSNRVSDAITYDMKYFAEVIDGYTLVPFTKKELFKARLKAA